MSYKIFLIVLIINFSNFYSQKIGVIQNFNPNIKHAHLKGGYNYKTISVEDLNYNILSDIDSIFIQNKIEPQIITDFDFTKLNNFDPYYTNKNRGIEADLRQYCIEKKLDALIIMKSNNVYHSLDPLKTVNNDGYNIAILTKDNSKRALAYYSNIQLLYYKLKTNKIDYPIVKVQRPNYFLGFTIKTKDPAFDPDSFNLINPSEHLKNFLAIYKQMLQIYISEIITKIKE